MTPKSSAKGILFAIGAFVLLGTIAALWKNPFFIRMTPTSGFEVGLLALQALLIGAYVAIPISACATKLASVGGVANFIGIACPICNKFFLLVFSANALLTYLEPSRLYLAAGGVLITAFAVFVRWQTFQAVHEELLILTNEEGRLPPPEEGKTEAEIMPLMGTSKKNGTLVAAHSSTIKNSPSITFFGIHVQDTCNQKYFSDYRFGSYRCLRQR